MERYWSDEEVLLAGQEALAERIPSEKLLGYLKKFQNDSLTTGTSEGLPSFTTQRDMLVAAMRKKYAAGQKHHQYMRSVEVGAPKFWELVLSMDFVSHEIELVNNIGYDNEEIFPGLPRPRKPYAEFTIIDEDLKRAIAPITEPAALEADVFMRQGFVCITIANHKTYHIAKLDKDGPYQAFMDHLLAPDNAEIVISIEEIKKINGLAATKDLSEVARHCGFNRVLKKAFFKDSKGGKLCFMPSARLDSKQVEAVKKQAAKLELKNRK